MDGNILLGFSETTIFYGEVPRVGFCLRVPSLPNTNAYDSISLAYLLR